MIEASVYRFLTVERTGGVASVTLANPEKRNALSAATMRELHASLEAVGRDREVRVVVLRALGTVFSSGHDLREMRCAGDEGDVAQIPRDLRPLRIRHGEDPIDPPTGIAEIDGIATAAGCQLVATCDLAIASEHSKFATPGVKIGLFCTTPMVALTRAIGRKRAMEMLLTGEFVDAATAASWGLINRAVPAENLRAEVDALAQRIVAASGFVVGLGKNAFYAQIDLDQPKAYAYAKEVMSMNALAADAQEGIGAFLERRVPAWKQ